MDNVHPSQRGWFAAELYKQMAENKDIWLITGDLGYKQFDKIQEDFPERFVNVGAAEQAGLGISVGLALEGKIPFFYSITTFALYRGFETIRNYIDHEKIPVRIVGSGRDRDYAHDGFSHWADDAPEVLKLFNNIQRLNPATKEDLPHMVKMMVTDSKPWFLSLKR